MKKLSGLLVAGAMTLCVGSYVSAADVTVETVYGSVEISGNPERVCVLDVNVLDDMDTLELGEYVTTVMHKKMMPSYLEEYYNSDQIIVLQKERNANKGQNGEKTEKEAQTADGAKAENAAADEDPYELYYSIDAELIIASAETVDEDLYAVLSQIAPTVVLDYAMNYETGMYDGVKENARTIASIWGMEKKVDELTADYDTVYQQLSEKLAGVRGVILSSGLDSGRLQIVSNKEEQDGKEVTKATIEKHGQMLTELGMVLVSDELPEEVAAASVFEKNAEAEVVAQKSQTIAAWVDEANPDYVILTDRSFASVEAAKAEGYTCEALENMALYQEGRVCEMSADGNIGTGGLHGTFMQLDELKAFFLE